MKFLHYPFIKVIENHLTDIILSFSKRLLFPSPIFFEGDKNSKDKNKKVAKVGPLKITAEELIYSYEFGPAFPKRTDNSKKNALELYN